MTNLDSTARAEALNDIVLLAERYAISGAEIAGARSAAQSVSGHIATQKSIMSRLFNYIGGILVFCGFAVFVAMYWDDFAPAFRVAITLGTGFCAFVAAVAYSRRGQFSGAIAPLFLIAAFFETSGLFVMLYEYGSGDNWRHAVLFISGLVGFQFAMTYIAIRQGVLAFFALLLGGVFASTGMDLIGIDYNVIGIGIGIAYLCLATALSQTLTARQAGFWHLAGALFLMCAFYDVVENTAYDITFAGLAALLVYLSIVVRSRALLIVSTLSLIWYIGDYAFDIFADSGLFPLGLIAAGAIFMGLGSAAMKIDRRFIRQKV